MRFFLSTLVLCLLSQVLPAQNAAPHRVIILTDIEADPDDTQSLVRLLLYANGIDIRGIVATTSCWKRTNVEPASIVKVIEAYGKVHANLSRHEAGFPPAETLLARVTEGRPKYGMLGVGAGEDSPGSELIIKELDADDDRPLWISTWGGVNTLAQALYKLRETRSKAEVKRLVAKLRVYTISDQDDSGIWLRNNFPELFFIVSPGDDYGSATWSAINTVVKGIDNTTISNGWLAENIQQGHGALGAVYPDVAWGVEGDTPAFLYLIPNGLNDAEHPEWGGWGGRYAYYLPDFSQQKKGNSGVPFEAETRKIWTNATDKYTPYVHSNYGRNLKRDTMTFTTAKASLWRWRDDFQHDFAARIDWCTQDYASANHPPVPVLGHPARFTVKSGQGFEFDASGSTDPDGDNLTFLWFHYPEAGSYQEVVSLGAENVHGVYATAPKVDQEETLHFIVKVTDKGSPTLTRYQRVIVTVVPE